MTFCHCGKRPKIIIAIRNGINHFCHDCCEKIKGEMHQNTISQYISFLKKCKCDRCEKELENVKEECKRYPDIVSFTDLMNAVEQETM